MTAPTTMTAVSPHISAHVRMIPRPSTRPYTVLAVREKARTYADAENSEMAREMISANVPCALEPMIVPTTVWACSESEPGTYCSMSSEVSCSTSAWREEKMSVAME